MVSFDSDDLPAFAGANAANLAAADAIPIFQNGPPQRLVTLSELSTYFQGIDADLTALGGVTSAADAVPYFTGVGTADVMTVTAAARTVLDDTTVGAMVDTLGGATTTGTGGLARKTSPVFVTPALGTPASGVLTNCTGLPATGLLAPRFGVLTETHLASTFTDGGGAVGTKTMTGTIPASAVILGTKVLVAAGFTGDTSAALTIGDGSDVDRYNTSTVNVFTTAATGVQSGVPSGDKLQVAAVSPVLTVTSNADITPVIAAAGSVTVSIYYLATV